MAKKKATRNAPEPNQILDVSVVQPVFYVAAIDGQFSVEVNTKPTLIGEADPVLMPQQLAVSEWTQIAVEPIEIDIEGLEEPLDEANVTHFQIQGRATWTDIPSWNSEKLVGDIPVDEAKDLTYFTVWGQPIYGVDPDAECNNRPAFGLLYPRRAT